MNFYLQLFLYTGLVCFLLFGLPYLIFNVFLRKRYGVNSLKNSNSNLDRVKKIKVRNEKKAVKDLSSSMMRAGREQRQYLYNRDTVDLA